MCQHRYEISVWNGEYFAYDAWKDVEIDPETFLEIATILPFDMKNKKSWAEALLAVNSLCQIYSLKWPHKFAAQVVDCQGPLGDYLDFGCAYENGSRILDYDL